MLSITTANTKDTLNHYKGRLWLSKPLNLSTDQDIKICYENDDGSFTALFMIYLKPNGEYYARGKNKDLVIGTVDSVAFKEYTNSLLGLNTPGAGDEQAAQSREDIHKEVIAIYQECGSMKKTARQVGVSEDTVKKILLSNGLYKSDLFDKISTLTKSGKSVSTISEELGISKKAVRSYLPYE